MTIFCFMSVVTIISDFSCQIPARKNLNDFTEEVSSD